MIRPTLLLGLVSVAAAAQPRPTFQSETHDKRIVDLSLRRPTLDRLLTPGMAAQETSELAPGRCVVRAVVRDSLLGLVSVAAAAQPRPTFRGETHDKRIVDLSLRQATLDRLLTHGTAVQVVREVVRDSQGETTAARNRTVNIQ